MRRRPAAARRKVKVISHLRRKRPKGLKYKTESQRGEIRSIPIGVCNQCGEICIRCKAKAIVAKVKKEKRDPPTGDDSDGARSDSLSKDLGRLMEEDDLVEG